jgi:hypothetical protein
MSLDAVRDRSPDSMAGEVMVRAVTGSPLGRQPRPGSATRLRAPFLGVDTDPGLAPGDLPAHPVVDQAELLGTIGMLNRSWIPPPKFYGGRTRSSGLFIHAPGRSLG